jgi:hypothetical protein
MTFREGEQAMRRLAIISVAAVVFFFGTVAVSKVGPKVEAKRWTDSYDVASCNWSSTGGNDFFVLQPGYQQVFDGREGTTSTHLVITVLDETHKVGNVETRVIEERESHGGALIEVSRNYFAVCRPTNDVFYFGEDVDMYEHGKVVNHEGSWMAERGGAKAGLFMPARPLLGARFYQEVAPGVAMDRVEIASDIEIAKTPAGEFQNAVKTEETTPLEPGVKEYKVYARGVGIVRDGSFFLTRYGNTAAH